MGDNIPSPSTAPKRPKRKYDKTKLPTPPPDPNEKNTDDREEFLAYLDSLQKSNVYLRSTSTFAPVIATEDAFDHLEKLYKMMEQMLELREQNVRLHRRVRDLEHFNNLEKMHKELNVERECPELDKDTAFAETILESILQETKPSKKNSTPSRLRHSISKKPRNRSGSVSVEVEKQDQNGDRRASTCVDSRAKPSKVSKWTKVKAAFKWEKASPTVSDTKSQDSGIGGIAPVEVARYLHVPSTSGCDDGHSPADSGAAEISTPGTLSTASSNEDFHRNDLRNPCDDLRSSDDEHSHISHSKDGSQKSNKSHKTPWAKMKDIIHTRNSFKKRHRLSAQSDDIQIDVELCSDNEDVFEDDQRSKGTSPICTNMYKRLDSSEVPPEVIERYQKAIAEDGTIHDYKKISKWSRVKKAFLAPSDTDQSTSPSPNKESPKLETESNTVQAEIQRNYKQLQKKFSLEFQEKLSEWERMKQSSPGTSNPSSSCGFAEERDPAFMKKMEEWQKLKSQPSTKNRPTLQLTSEENLPPEFRKKLQEWEKIRKNSNKESGSKKKIGDVPRWKSLSANKRDISPTFEYSNLSYDFKKKLEEWKQIKAGGNVDDSDKKIKDASKTSSPRLSRKNSSKKKKESHEKELQWFEKELGKIEKEKQRLEREKQKYLEREERLAKIRNSIIGSYKKDILIHTPSGFHRFEGISRKFTQRLYEWEKAQGIGPESSTFTLLNSSLISDVEATPKRPTGIPPSLTRSKSADSIAISALNLACPLMSQPSSLSLNDMEELEKECLANSKSSSIHFTHSHETLNEPEAIIVEVEDIVEETAAPLRFITEKTQQPVYQRQELKAMCESEINVNPKVRRSESTRAQNNYNIIEEIFNVLKNLTENELEIQKTQNSIVDTTQNKRTNANILKLQSFDETQKHISVRLNEKVLKLQEANSNLFSTLMKDDFNSNIVEVLDTIQDLSTEIIHLSEKLHVEVNNRNIFDNYQEGGAMSLSPILEVIKDVRAKMLELRRKLSYLCAASDLTAPNKKPSKKRVKKTSSNDSQKESNDSKGESEKSTKENRLYIKSENSNVQSQGAIKKRIRYRQNRKEKTIIDSDEEEEKYDPKKNNHKKVTRTRSVSESSNTTLKSENVEKPKEEIVVDEDLIKKIVVPTKTNFVTVEEVPSKLPDTPVTVFVKTTRKIFTPLVESGVAAITCKEDDKTNKSDVDVEAPKIKKESIPEKETGKSVQPQIESECNSNDSVKTQQPVAHLPPLPASPTIQRKVTKDISPSIRLMLAKYNQKLTEQDSATKSGGSSGSVSPAWRSPKSERRVKAQTEKYQECLNKLSPLLNERKEVYKSASTSHIGKSENKPNQSIANNSFNSKNDDKNILKSSSTSVITKNINPDNFMKKSEESQLKISSELRLKKLQKAKEEFLKSTPQSAPPQLKSEELKFPTRNRLSQISFDSESSYDSAYAGALIKSASAGMINVDEDTYRQFDPEIHGDGYVSLPRSTKKQKEGLLSGKFAFSNIASKFRKVKMRKGKDKDKMNVVPILCRQSLVVDINNQHDPNNSGNISSVSMEDVSNVDKSKSWIKRTKLFKK